MPSTETSETAEATQTGEVTETTEGAAETESGTERLVLFTDAVAAIALTLLVLPLVEVFAEADADAEPLSELVSSHLGALGAFLLGFVLIARLWWAHHQLMRHVERVSGPLVRSNFLWILAIVVLPVTTQVITAYAPAPAPVAIYSSALVLASGALTAMAFTADRHPGLLREGASVRPQLIGTATTCALLTLAMVVGTVFAGTVNYFAYLLLLLSGPVEKVIGKRWPAAR